MISFSNIWITLLNIFKYLYMCFLSCWVWVTPFPYAQPTQSHQRFHTPVKHSIFVWNSLKEKKIPITTTTNTNSFLTTISVFLNAAEWIHCNSMSNFLLCWFSEDFWFVFIITPVPSPHAFLKIFLCLTKLSLQNLITFCLSNPRIHFYILLLLWMMFWKLIYIATAGVKAGK